MASTTIRSAALAAACAFLIGGCDDRDPPTADRSAAPAPVAAAAPGFPPARPLVPFVKSEVHCSWDMHAKGKEKWIRGGIGQGDEHPMLQLVDRAFDKWSDSRNHKIEISVGYPKRRLPGSAWASPASGDTPGSASFYMTPELRKLIGGATSIQIWKDGVPLFHAQLANTPSAAELDACVQKPGWDVDSEHDSELE